MVADTIGNWRARDAAASVGSDAWCARQQFSNPSTMSRYGRKMKMRFIGLAVLVSLAFCANRANAQSYVASGTVTTYQTGWSLDAVKVQTTAPFVDLGCGLTDGYYTSPNDPGNHAHQAALLSAFMAGRPVTLVISGCYGSRPQIIGVNLQ